MPLSLYVQRVSCSFCSTSSEQASPVCSSCSSLSSNSCSYSLYIVKVLCPAFILSSVKSPLLRFDPQVKSVGIVQRLYSVISVTTPAPTVLPPSLTANLSSFSIAIGTINSTSIVTLSPGITISTPSGSFATPVTSVVLK